VNNSSPVVGRITPLDDKAPSVQDRIVNHSLALAKELVPDAVDQQRRTIQRLEEKNGRLLATIDFLNGCIGGADTSNNNPHRAALRIDLLAWLLANLNSLVIVTDGHPILLGTDRNESDIRTAARFIVAFLCSESTPCLALVEQVLRPRCRVDLGGCGYVDCSCGQMETVELELPVALTRKVATS